MAEQVNQQGANVTASEEEIRSFITQELEKDKQLQAKNNNRPYTPPAPDPLKVTLDGKEFQFKDHQELSAALQTAFDQQRQRENQYKQQLEAAATPAPRKKSKEDGDDKVEWDFNTYVKKMGEDPREAQNYLDENRFGYNPVKKLKKLEKKYDELMVEVQNSKRERIANGFLQAHQEFPASPEAANVIDSIMQNMQYEYSPAGLEAAWAIAQTKGWLKPLDRGDNQQQQASQQQFNQAPPSFGRQTPAPPRVGRSSNSTEGNDIFAQAEDMNSDQLEALLQRYSQR